MEPEQCHSQLHVDGFRLRESRVPGCIQSGTGLIRDGFIHQQQHSPQTGSQPNLDPAGSDMAASR